MITYVIQLSVPVRLKLLYTAAHISIQVTSGVARWSGQGLQESLLSSPHSVRLGPHSDGPRALECLAHPIAAAPLLIATSILGDIQGGTKNWHTFFVRLNFISLNFIKHWPIFKLISLSESGEHL